MTEINTLLLMSLGELLLVTTAIAVVLVVLYFIKKRRDRSAATTLVARVKEDQERRQQETRGVLEKRFGIGGDYLDELVTKVVREEKRFYQTLINLYLKRDAGALENLHVAFEGATEPYRTLELPARPTDGDTSTE